MSTFKIIAKLTFVAMLAGCSNYVVPTQSLVSQLKEHQKIERNVYYQQFSLVDYPSNNLQRIECIDKNGSRVWLYPDKNTEFIFVKKSDGKKVKAYFDTVLFQNDTLVGLRSRLMGGVRVIPVSDIDKVEVYAEFPTVEKVQ